MPKVSKRAVLSLGKYVWDKRSRIAPLVLHRGPQTLLGLAQGAGVLWGANERALARYRDLHAGRRAFIIGTGPSLRVSDLDRLQHELTFSCNKIYLAFDQTVWRPSYYAVSDLLVAEQQRVRIESQTCPKFFPSALRHVIGEDAGTFVRSLPLLSAAGHFSTNLMRGYYEGNSVLHFLLQLAYFMGIREIYMLGLDFEFVTPNVTAEHSGYASRWGALNIAANDVLAGQGEVNHFHPDYRPKGELWVAPNLEKSRRAFGAANEAFRRAGGRVWNASRKTRLDVFPRIPLDEVLAS
jgi:hypothetical protein